MDLTIQGEGLLLQVHCGVGQPVASRRSPNTQFWVHVVAQSGRKTSKISVQFLLTFAG